MNLNDGIQKYEVTFVVRKDDGSIEHKWTAAWNAQDFAEAERLAIRQLQDNNDMASKIERIELW